VKSRYFRIEEFVSKPVAIKFGEKAWAFIDPRLVETMDFIRELSEDHKITINTWLWGGNYSQRGLRENTSDIVKEKTKADEMYLSAHVLGMAVDFDVEGYSAEQIREVLGLIKDKLPHKIRLEQGVNWVHLDVRDDNEEKIHLF